MQQQRYVFESPERFVVGTVGQPGERAFFLQASASGRVVTVGLEKSEVAVLAEGLIRLIHEVRKAGAEIPPAATGYLDKAPLEAPFEEDFHLDQLTVSWDGHQVQVEAFGSTGDTPPEVAVEADEPELDVLQVMLSLDQTYEFVARAKDLVSAGRPPCVLCGRPDGAGGHFCPRLN